MRRLSLVAAAALALLAGGGAVRAHGQESAAEPPEERRVEGRVLRPGPRDPLAVTGVWVTLHRVGRGAAGPVDSTRTGRGGSYAFAYRAARADDAVFLVSAEYGGIAYFAPPLESADVRGAGGDIVVFDTTSADVPLSLQGRHVIVGLPAPDGVRDVIEILELSNDTTLTRVPGLQGRAVFTAVLPADSREHTVGGDLATGAAEFLDGRFLLFSPLSPGLRQITYGYRMPAGAFPMRVPLERPTAVLEVLVEEQAASAAGGGLEEVDPVAAEGRTFRRFVAQDVPANVVITVSVPTPPPSIRPLWIAGTILAVGIVLLMALSRAFHRRDAHASIGGGVPALTADELDRRIAALDAAFAAYPHPADEARESYRARRQALLAEREARSPRGSAPEHDGGARRE